MIFSSWFSTLKNPSLSTDAVTEPVKIRDESIAKFAMLMLVIPLPSPLIIPLTTFILPLISTEPVNSEPICEPVAEVITWNLSALSADAVTEPLEINGAAAA